MIANDKCKMPEEGKEDVIYQLLLDVKVRLVHNEKGRKCVSSVPKCVKCL